MTVTATLPDMQAADGKGAAAVMPLREHLAELRTRLIKAVSALLVGTSAGWALRNALIGALTRPVCLLQHVHGVGGANTGCANGVLVLQGMLTPLGFSFKVALTAGVLLSSPVWSYQLWAFLAPGLYRPGHGGEAGVGSGAEHGDGEEDEQGPGVGVGGVAAGEKPGALSDGPEQQCERDAAACGCGAPGPPRQGPQAYTCHDQGQGDGHGRGVGGHGGGECAVQECQRSWTGVSGGGDGRHGAVAREDLQQCPADPQQDPDRCGPGGGRCVAAPPVAGRVVG
jgi:hypothetical protein